MCACFYYCPQFLTDSPQEQVTDNSNTTSATLPPSTTTPTTSPAQGNNNLGKADEEAGTFL